MFRNGPVPLERVRLFDLPDIDAAAPDSALNPAAVRQIALHFLLGGFALVPAAPALRWASSASKIQFTGQRLADFVVVGPRSTIIGNACAARFAITIKPG